MAPSTSYVSGARAIKIPLHGSLDNVDYQTSARRQRSSMARPSKHERTESSDHDNASSIGSDTWAQSPASSSSSSSNPQHLSHIQHAVASPSKTTPTSTTLNNHQRKDKQRATSTDLAPPNRIYSQSPLGPNMLSSSSYKSINLNSHVSGDSDEPARLITYTKHSQGFTWNDELFLPSYMVGRHRYGAHRGAGRNYHGGYSHNDEDDDDTTMFDEDGEKCPVTDIFVTDEEAAAMMP